MAGDLDLYNTLTDEQEGFVPRAEGGVKLFTCGPSVYRRQHLGNYRTYLFEDVLQRYLEHRGFEVERLINFTDCSMVPTASRWTCASPAWRREPAAWNGFAE